MGMDRAFAEQKVAKAGDSGVLEAQDAERHLNVLRPHVVGIENANRLCIGGTDLFQWAEKLHRVLQTDGRDQPPPQRLASILEMMSQS